MDTEAGTEAAQLIINDKVRLRKPSQSISKFFDLTAQRPGLWEKATKLLLWLIESGTSFNTLNLTSWKEFESSLGVQFPCEKTLQWFVSPSFSQQTPLKKPSSVIPALSEFVQIDNIKRLKGVLTVSSTTDAWSQGMKHLVVYTIHWINSEWKPEWLTFGVRNIQGRMGAEGELLFLPFRS